MKKLILSIVAVAVASTLLVDSTYGGTGSTTTSKSKYKYRPKPTTSEVDLPIGGILTKPASTDVIQRPDRPTKESKGGMFPLPKLPANVDLMAGVGFRSFTASRRASRRVDLTGIISNGASEPKAGVMYAISRWNGSSWAQIKQGTVVVAAKSQVTVSMTVASSEALRFKMDLLGSGKKFSKEASVRAARQIWVVQTTAKPWRLVWYQKYDSDASDRMFHEGSQRDAWFSGLGFNTERRRTVPGVFGDEHIDRIYARAERDLEWTFETEAEAKEFRGLLHNRTAVIHVNNETAPDPFFTSKVFARFVE